MITICTIESEADLLATLALQKANLRQNVPFDEQISNGFVTVEHRPDVLRRMNNTARTIIAKNSTSQLIGYALTMLPEFASQVPELHSLFSGIELVKYKDKPLHDYEYYVLGQVCVEKRYQGQNIFGQMLHMHREMYSQRYQLLVTSISSKNQRSIRAHLRLGFEILHTFDDPIFPEPWHILLWDWQK